MSVETFARFEKYLRTPLVRILPAPLTVKLYSEGKLQFLKRYYLSTHETFDVPPGFGRKCWGLTFRFPLFNAAGMFKNAEGLARVSAEGAGAYLAGTTTSKQRAGNRKGRVRLAFASYPASHAASNWLGLPNIGHRGVAKILAEAPRKDGFPIGASLMGDPDLQGEEKLSGLIDGLRAYAESGVDFIELNESCPNTEEGPPQASGLKSRLERIRADFLASRSTGKPLPVIVKFSNDTELAQVPALVELLVSMGFDGVNFGNTSTDYLRHRELIRPGEQRLYDYFTKTFGGGVSGRPVGAASLRLVAEASTAARALAPDREFHVIRTGGVFTGSDVQESLASGASLVQWYTGYFERMSEVGADVYRTIAQELSKG